MVHGGRSERFILVAYDATSALTDEECVGTLSEMGILYANKGGTADYNICPLIKDRCFFIYLNFIHAGSSYKELSFTPSQ